MPQGSTTTLHKAEFHSPSELAEALADLLVYANRFHSTSADLVNLETDLHQLRLVEHRLTDGSHVYNIEIRKGAQLQTVPLFSRNIAYQDVSIRRPITA